MLQVSFEGEKNLRRFDNMLGVLSGKEKNLVIVRAVKRAGDQAKSQVIRALAKQTGLKQVVIRKAIGKPKLPNFDDYRYVMQTKGGEVSLKHFKPRETRKGVVAYPFGKKTLFPGTFLKSGHWGSRKLSPKLRGQVYTPASSSKKWGRDFEGPEKSGVVIPEQMIKGETAKAFNETAKRVLPRRIEHELQRILL